MLALPPLLPHGSRVYKFASPELPFLEPVVRQHTLWARPAAEMNDPRECKPRLREGTVEEHALAILKNWIRGRQVSDAEREDALARIRGVGAASGAAALLRTMQDGLHDLLGQFRLYCMTKRWDNLAMWAHYGAEHKGYCLEFVSDGLFADCREVVYDGTVRLDFGSDDVYTSFFYKHPDWRFEEEVRLVLPRFQWGASIRFGDPRLLSQIIVGKDADESTTRGIMSMALSRVPPLPVVRAVYEPFTQSLVLVPVTLGERAQI